MTFHIPGVVSIALGQVPDWLCDRIISVGDSAQVQEATVYDERGVSVDAAVRKTKVAWIQEPWVRNVARAMALSVNRLPGWEFCLTGEQLPQYGVYGPGSFFNWHIDRLAGVTPERKLTLVIQLDDGAEYAGGDLEFRHAGAVMGSPDYRKRGSVFVMAGTTEHRVTPVISGRRRSLAVWFEGIDNS